jgi:hypothetical protein
MGPFYASKTPGLPTEPSFRLGLDRTGLATSSPPFGKKAFLLWCTQEAILQPTEGMACFLSIHSRPGPAGLSVYIQEEQGFLPCVSSSPALGP